uniref:F-box domain-containing protein n=1 Tax=Steinernema glaseri TaxID=37863 RepID=A0A1I7YQG0_9BILA
MDHLLYDLVEEVVSYLPRADVETIAKVAGRSPALENWSIASEDQLDRRVALKVCVHLQDFERRYDDSSDEEEERIPRIRLSVQKLLSDGSWGEWDFKNWRYAWIQIIDISASVIDYLGTMDAPEKTFKESDIDQVLRLVSLPVDRSPRSKLSLGYDCNNECDCFCDSFTDMEDLFWEIIENTQKEFASLYVYNSYDHNIDGFGSFVADSIEREAFLDYLSYNGQRFSLRNICVAIAPWFGKTRGRPLKVAFTQDDPKTADVELFIDTWLKSDGTFEEKELNECFTVNEKYKTVTLGDSSSRYLVHPTKRSSLLIGFTNCLLQHVPLEFQWIDSVIDEWKEGCGFNAWRRWVNFFFSFKEAEDWDKLLEKYGPAVDGGNRLPIAHLTGATFLEVTKSDDWFEIEVKYEYYTKRRLASLISRWKKGNGETLVNGLTKMYVEIAKDLSVTPQHSHPLGKTRCLIVQQYIHCGRALVRISILPIDPEEVEDWHLELLFGSLQV